MNWNLPLFDTKITGVELTILTDGSYSYNMVVIEKRGSKIETLQSVEGASELSKCIDATNKSNPILLSVKGKGIIHKRVTANTNESFELLLNKVLPNSNVEDFYVQVFRIDAESAFASVVRRTVVDAVVNSLTKEGYKLVACFLGPFSVQSVLPLLQNEDESSSEIKFSNHELLVRDGSIVNYTPLSVEEERKDIVSNALNISSNSLVAFASAFSYFNKVDAISSNISDVENAYFEFKQEVKFKKTGVIVLGIFFAVLLLNFVAFSYLSDSVNSKSSTALLSSSELSLIDSMNRQIQERTLFLSKSGLSEPSRTSFYADEIAKDLPDVITLSSIIVQPLKTNTNDERKLEFESKKILVSGKSKYSLDVNEWIRSMRGREWINSISLINYSQKEEGIAGEFLLEIKLR